jgi:hypothetical protein
VGLRWWRPHQALSRAFEPQADAGWPPPLASPVSFRRATQTYKEARIAEQHASTISISQALAFGRSLVTGHAFLARFPEASRGGRFLGYMLANVPSSHHYLGERSNVNTRQALFTTIKNGDLLRWSKQLAMRGAARNFDDQGVCGKMKLVAIGDLDLWMQSHGLMFPGATFDMSKATQAKAKAAGGAQAVAAFVLTHVGDSFTSKEVCAATGVRSTGLARCLRSPTVRAAMASTGTVYVQGKGRAPSRFAPAQPLAIAAE